MDPKLKKGAKKHFLKDGGHNMGLRTKVWGPPGWVFFHCVAFGYPMDPKAFNKKNGGNVKKRYKTFYESLGYIFPCKYCRDSYRKFIKEIPVDKYLDSRVSLTYWTFLIHNKVNKKLGAKCLSGKDYCDKIVPRYEGYRAKCTPETKKEKKIKNSDKGCVVSASSKLPLKCKISFEPDTDAARAAGFGSVAKLSSSSRDKAKKLRIRLTYTRSNKRYRKSDSRLRKDIAQYEKKRKKRR